MYAYICTYDGWFYVRICADTYCMCIYIYINYSFIAIYIYMCVCVYACVCMFMYFLYYLSLVRPSQAGGKHVSYLFIET